MSRFDDLGSAYMGSVLTDLHGETVTVHPQGSASYTIKAIVNRDVAELNELGGGHPRIGATLEVRDDSTAGIAIGTLNRGTLQVELALERPGGSTGRYRVGNFADPVGGMISLEIYA